MSFVLLFVCGSTIMLFHKSSSTSFGKSHKMKFVCSLKSTCFQYFLRFGGTK